MGPATHPGGHGVNYERLALEEDDRTGLPAKSRKKTRKRVVFACFVLIFALLVSAAVVWIAFGSHEKTRDAACRPGRVEVVLTPSASALGNYSQWAVSTDAAPCTPVARGQAETLIAREMAPAAATADMFVKDRRKSVRGGLAVGVPGELRGYEALHRRLNGSLPWKALFADAIRLARHGFPMGAHLANALREQMEIKTDHLSDNIRRAFTNPETGELLQEGELVKQEDLAETLEAVAENGAEYFYKGNFAKELVTEIQSKGGLITEKDLMDYSVDWRKPVSAQFQDGLTLFSVPPPASGAVLAYILGIMDAFRAMKGGALLDDVLTLHRFAEACKFAYAKRALLGDNKGQELEELVGNLTSQEFAAKASASINDEETFADPARYGFVNESQPPDHGTAHATFWGPDGDVIAVSTTVNYYFGSQIRTSSGVVLNNQMDDFSTPGSANVYGVAPSKANFIAPRKRPMSSMAPVVVLDRNGNCVLALGGSGGSKITSGVALVAMRVLWMGNNIKQAIDFPRIHHQLIPNKLMAESFFPKTYEDELRRRGHIVTHPEGRFSIMMGVQSSGGRLLANSDFRKGGTVDGH
ncbi:scoloptoxin SSD14-like isoform X2 [Haemaphysalis longicornis]